MLCNSRLHSIETAPRPAKPSAIHWKFSSFSTRKVRVWMTDRDFRSLDLCHLCSLARTLSKSPIYLLLLYFLFSLGFYKRIDSF